jgi:hypothetical protein
MAQSLEHLAARIRADVTDTYDVATQLETLGINPRRAKRRYGYASVFDLAHELFRFVNPHITFPTVKPLRFPLFRHLAIIVSLILSLLDSSLYPWISLAAMLVWSIVFSRLLGQTKADSENKTYARIFTLAYLCGLLLIAGWALFTTPNSSHLKVLLLWWNLNLAFWQPKVSYWRVLLTLCFAALGLVYPWIGITALLALGCAYFSALKRPTISTWHYIKIHRWGLIFTTLYALAQAVLIGTLFKNFQPSAIGIIMLSLIVLAAEWLEGSLKHTLVNHLWSSTNREDYHARLLGLLRFWGQLLGLVVLVVMVIVLQLYLPFYKPLLNVVLLGVALGLSIVLLGFEQLVTVSLTLAVGAFLVFSGIPFMAVMIGIIAIFLTGMMLLITRVEEYAASIL